MSNGAELPHVREGQRIGLLGGSFDPAHDGHLALSRVALKRLRLDAVWWLVTPGNPLKPNAPAPLQDRLKLARSVAQHPRIHVCAPEATWGTVRTLDLLERLKTVRPGVKFVWLMGSDNLAGFNRWYRWRRVAHTLPMAVIARPGARARALLSPAARTLAQHRLKDSQAAMLPELTAPAWVFLSAPLNAESSTRLRLGTKPD